MGSNNNKNQQPAQSTGYGPNAGSYSNNDPKGAAMNQNQYQQQRFESQQGPLADAMSYNYGRGSEADYGNYTNMMNQYNDIASNGGGSTGYVSGGGGGYSPFLVHPQQVATERANAERANTQVSAPARALSPLERVQAQQMNPLQQVNAQRLGPLERVTASDPYQGYKGYQQFADTGGYSGQDIADMRARGVAPIRAAYDAAARNVGQQRSLQGGYSPNAIAAQVKMAREQGQSMADASQNVDAGIAAARNAGRLSGLAGMSNIDQARQQAQMQGDIFNAGQANQGQQFDITNAMNSGMFNSNQAFQGNQFDIANKLNADQYNSGQAFQGQQFDIGNELQNNQFNVGQGNNMNQFNAGQANQTSQFNAGQGNNMGQFNANLDFQGQQYNAQAQQQAAAAGAAASAANAAAQNQYNQQQTANRLAALNGAQNLYGTTPGMSATFGNQALSAVNSGANFGIGMMNATNNAQNNPGAFDQSMNRIGQVMNFAQPVSNAIYPWLNGNNPRQGTQPVNGGVTYQGGGSYVNPYGNYVEDPNG